MHQCWKPVVFAAMKHSQVTGSGIVPLNSPHGSTLQWAQGEVCYVIYSNSLDFGRFCFWCIYRYKNDWL